MKTTKKLRYKHFRYLTKKDIKNPLFKIAGFCRSWTSLEGYMGDIKCILKADKSRNPQNLTVNELSDLLFDIKLTLTNIELLYVLHHTIENWKLDETSPYYAVKITALGASIEDNTLYKSNQVLLFERLTKAEIKDIGKFIKKFFRLLTLREWQRLMEDLQQDFFSEYDISCLVMYQGNFKKIYKYLKKLAETIFFIYATKGKEHIFKHHVKDFNLGRYLGKDPTALSEETEAQD